MSNNNTTTGSPYTDEHRARMSEISQPASHRDEITKPVPATPATVTLPAQEHILQFFSFDHLPTRLQEVSRPFALMADALMDLPRNPERTVALRKLLESKDAAVRAALAK